MIATLTIDEVNIFLMMRIAIANYVLNLMQIGQDFAVQFFVGDCRDIVASQRAFYLIVFVLFSCIAITKNVLNLMQIGQYYAVKVFVGDCRVIVGSQRA